MPFPGDVLFATATDGAKVAIGSPGKGCRLGDSGVQQRLGLAQGATASSQVAATVVPALAVADPKSVTNESNAVSRLVVVDLNCKISQSLTNYYAAPPAYLFAFMAQAIGSGYLDVQDKDGKWGSWNLRTDRWDLAPCCAAPAHTTVLARGKPYQVLAEYPSSENALVKIWRLLRPLVLAYAAVAVVCLIVAASLEHRGAALVGQDLVVMPLRAVWLVIVLVIAANIYAVAGLLGSGALVAVASGTICSATRAWRK